MDNELNWLFTNRLRSKFKSHGLFKNQLLSWNTLHNVEPVHVNVKIRDLIKMHLCAAASEAAEAVSYVLLESPYIC